MDETVVVAVVYIAGNVSVDDAVAVVKLPFIGRIEPHFSVPVPVAMAATFGYCDEQGATSLCRLLASRCEVANYEFIVMRHYGG